MKALRWLVSAVGVSAALFEPQRASACEADESCDWTPPIPDSVDVRDTVIPADAAVVFEIGVGADTEAWSFAVQVQDATGLAVPGQVSRRAGFDEVSWRPDVPWQPGERYRVALAIELEAGAGAYPSCEPVHEIVDIEVVAPLGERPIPIVDVTEEIVIEPDDSLAGRVCCDGALPVRSEFPGPGYGCTTEVEIGFDQGACVIGEATRALRVNYAIDEQPGVDPSDYRLRLVLAEGLDTVGGWGAWASMTIDEAVCGRLEILEVGYGLIHVQDICHGQDPPEPLGRHRLDVDRELEEQCAGEPYVCEQEYEAWDGERCRPWGAGEDAPYLPRPMPPGATPPFADEQVGCAVAPIDRTGLVVLAVLMPLLRRRRSLRCPGPAAAAARRPRPPAGPRTTPPQLRASRSAITDA
jgi:hypothetical protein